jgi:hypothetical protein
MIPARLKPLGLVLAGVVLLGGCRDRAPEPPDMSEVFPSLPLPPGASFVSRSGGADALLITLRSPHPAKTVQGYYDDALSRNGWRVVSRTKGKDGGVVLLADQAGQPLWVRIRAAEDTSATLVELGGAVVSRADTAQATKPTS